MTVHLNKKKKKKKLFNRCILAWQLIWCDRLLGYFSPCNSSLRASRDHLPLQPNIINHITLEKCFQFSLSRCSSAQTRPFFQQLSILAFPNLSDYLTLQGTQ